MKYAKTAHVFGILFLALLAGVMGFHFASWYQRPVLVRVLQEDGIGPGPIAVMASRPFGPRQMFVAGETWIGILDADSPVQLEQAITFERRLNDEWTRRHLAAPSPNPTATEIDPWLLVPFLDRTYSNCSTASSPFSGCTVCAHFQPRSPLQVRDTPFRNAEGPPGRLRSYAPWTTRADQVARFVREGFAICDHGETFEVAPAP